MIAKIEKIAENLKLESQRIRHDAVARVRAFVLETAGAVARVKEPVRHFGSTGLKINEISHKSMAKLLKAQLTGLEDLVEGGAQRLQMAANASSFENLLKGQINAMFANMDVGFLELNAVTAALLEEIEGNRELNGETLLRQLAEKINYPDADALAEHGGEALREKRQLGILAGTLKST